MTTSTNIESNIETEAEIVCEYEEAKSETSSIKASSTNLHEFNLQEFERMNQKEEFERVNQKEGAFLFIKTIVPTITTLSIVIIWLIIFVI